MTEKRFMYNLHRGTILNNGKEIMPHEAMELLNALNDENVQLHSELAEKDIQLDYLQAENAHIKTVLEENKQLKKEIKRLKYHLNETEEELQEYKDFMSLG